jgi:hypothetical protein
MVDDRGVASNGVAPPPSWMPPLAPEAVYAILRQADSLPLWLVLRALDTLVKGLEVSIATAQHPGEVLGGFNGQLAPLPRATARLREMRGHRRWRRTMPRQYTMPRVRPSARAPRGRSRTTAQRTVGARGDPDSEPPPAHDVDGLRGFRAASSRMFAHVGRRLGAGVGA